MHALMLRSHTQAGTLGLDEGCLRRTHGECLAYQSWLIWESNKTYPKIAIRDHFTTEVLSILEPKPGLMVLTLHPSTTISCQICYTFVLFTCSIGLNASTAADPDMISVMRFSTMITRANHPTCDMIPIVSTPARRHRLPPLPYEPTTIFILPHKRPQTQSQRNTSRLVE